MEDLISRQRAIKAMDTWDKFGCDPNGMLVRYDDGKHYVPYVRYDDMVYVIKSQPSAEPEKGKWILDQNGMDWNIPAWRCSECGFVATHIGVEPNGLGDNPLNWAGSKFCPQCGARITGYER